MGLFPRDFKKISERIQNRIDKEMWLYLLETVIFGLLIVGWLTLEYGDIRILIGAGSVVGIFAFIVYALKD